MATTKTEPIGTWDTFHKNGPFHLTKLHTTRLEGPGNLPGILNRYNDAAAEIQRLIGQAAALGQGFRAYGSAWSLSDIPHHPDNMHYNGFMNLKLAIRPENLHAETAFSAPNLFFFQCGNRIKEISEYLYDHGKSLKTTGASNGQTIAGAISTGVHGSAIDVGAVQDYVVGLNLVIGPNPEDVVYLERASAPALNDAFAAGINARIIRDDALFNAALVGLGAFGFIHGVALEAEDVFLLKRYVKKIPKAAALDLALHLDDPARPFEIAGIEEDGRRPFHYKIFLNPYSDEEEYVVEAMYKKPYQPDYTNPIPFIRTAVYRDLIVLFAKVIERFPKTIPKLVKLLQGQVLPEVDAELEGPLKDIFWDAPNLGAVFAVSVGISHKDAARASELLVQLARDEGPVPGIYAMRFVKASGATLACTRFPFTCMLEMDGVQWKKSRKIMGPEKFYRRILEVLKANDIPFTLHWGKNAAWDFPNLAAHMYGPDAQTWMAQRSTLLSPAMAQVFSNPFLRRVGLDGAQFGRKAPIT